MISSGNNLIRLNPHNASITTVNIMQAIMAQAGMHTKAQTIVFSMAVDDTAGLYNYQNK